MTRFMSLLLISAVSMWFTTTADLEVSHEFIDDDTEFANFTQDQSMNQRAAAATGVSDCCKSPQCKDYRGYAFKTKTGSICQPWSSKKPHVPSKSLVTESKVKEFDLRENYCRNPSNGDTAWCYTMNEKKRWEYCDMAYCPAKCDENKCSKKGGICSELKYGGSECTCKKGWKGKNCDEVAADMPCVGRGHKYYRRGELCHYGKYVACKGPSRGDRDENSCRRTCNIGKLWTGWMYFGSREQRDVKDQKRNRHCIVVDKSGKEITCISDVECVKAHAALADCLPSYKSWGKYVC